MKLGEKMPIDVCFSSEEEKRDAVKREEIAFATRLGRVSEALSADRNNRIVGLCGPTCAGKTTAADRLCAAFAAKGRRVHIISVDDFYYDKEILHRLSAEEDGQIDYDSPKTIDLEALSACVGQIRAEGVLSCPRFDFDSGVRKEWREIRYGEDDVFMFEGIQVIYPDVLRQLLPYGFVGVYIAPMRTLCYDGVEISPNTLRLMRRLVRDSIYRATDPVFTLQLWQSVRANEEKRIFPFVDRFAYHIDSTFAYEPGILKPYLSRLLADVAGDEAEHIRQSIAKVDEIHRAYLEADSLYHEFI